MGWRGVSSCGKTREVEIKPDTLWGLCTGGSFCVGALL